MVQAGGTGQRGCPSEAEGQARRKDLKKIESVVNDLAMLIENW
jgi:t-SNARE complex subunit (syntaxin)